MPPRKTDPPAEAGESREEKRARMRKILRRLHRAYPEATCALRHENAFELLVATILSAQCTDERVNQVTRRLFRRFRRPEDYARSPPGELEEWIRPTGFYNNKAKALRGLGKALVERFGGEVPRTMEELLTLPGVARKTANVVLGTAFGIPSGIVVDTHVFRLAHRLGLSEGRTPEEVERDLMAITPKKEWIYLGHALIQHGRRVCKARTPLCDECVLADVCPSAHRAEPGNPKPARGRRRSGRS